MGSGTWSPKSIYFFFCFSKTPTPTNERHSFTHSSTLCPFQSDSRPTLPLTLVLPSDLVVIRTEPMKFGKSYLDALARPDFPEEWRQGVIEYKSLKKLINGVAAELEGLGLSQSVLQELLDQSSRSSSSSTTQNHHHQHHQDNQRTKKRLEPGDGGAGSQQPSSSQPPPQPGGSGDGGLPTQASDKKSGTQQGTKPNTAQDWLERVPPHKPIINRQGTTTTSRTPIAGSGSDSAPASDTGTGTGTATELASGRSDAENDTVPAGTAGSTSTSSRLQQLLGSN